LVLRVSAVAPEQHFFGDELVAAAFLFLDDVAAAKEEQGGGFGDSIGAHDRGAGGGVFLAADGVGEDDLADLLDERVIASEVDVVFRSG
jgi:hypothetical protein